MSSIQNVLKGIVPGFGVAVLGSYAWGATRSDVNKDKLWGPLKGNLFRYWLLSALLTASSFLYLWWLWAFDTKLSDTNEIVMLVFMCLFLVSASLWMYLTVQNARGKIARRWITWNLWTTAIASAGLMAMTTRLPLGIERWKQDLAIASGTMLVVQHVLFDAIFWNEGFVYAKAS